MDQEISNKLSELVRRVAGIEQLLRGDGAEAPGFMARVAMLERTVFGQENKQGLLFKVNLMWRGHVWVLCTMSAGVGFAAREVVKLIWKI